MVLSSFIGEVLINEIDESWCSYDDKERGFEPKYIIYSALIAPIINSAVSVLVNPAQPAYIWISRWIVVIKPLQQNNYRKVCDSIRMSRKFLL